MGALSYDDYVMSYDYVKEKQYDFDSVKLYFNEIKKIPLLSKEEEYDLLVKAKEGDIEARNRLIEANLRFVVSIAKKYINCGVPFLDVIQEGNLGIEKAIEGYDLESNYRFSTYASWWVKQSILRYIENSRRIIRLPSHLIDELSVYKRKKEQLECENNKIFSKFELSEELGIPLNKVYRNEVLLSDTISYDATIRCGNETGSELSTFLISDENIEETVMDSTLREEINKCILDTDLTMGETFILIKRFGLDGKPPLTLEEAAKILSVNKQRASQIEMSALKRMNSEMTKRRLNIFLYPNSEVNLSTEKNNIIFDESITDLSDDLKEFFSDKDLSVEEIKILIWSLGLINGVKVSNTEIAQRLNKTLREVKNERKIAIEKINKHHKVLKK